MNYLFLAFGNADICNFADDTSPYSYKKPLEKLLKSIEKIADLALNWFENNYMKLSTDKCRLIVSGYKHEHVKIGTEKTWEKRDVKLLGINIVSKWKFDK